MFLDDPKTKLTYEHYLLLPDDGKQHEIINGRHYMNAAPTPRHQTISRRIQFQLMEQIENTGHGQVFNSPIDVQFDDFNVVQPDLVLVLNQNDIVIETRLRGVPDFVVEILSPSTREKDVLLKKQLYEQNGVPVYWIVDPKTDTVLVHQLDSTGRYNEPEAFTDQVSFVTEAVSATVDLKKVW